MATFLTDNLTDSPALHIISYKDQVVPIGAHVQLQADNANGNSGGTVARNLVLQPSGANVGIGPISNPGFTLHLNGSLGLSGITTSTTAVAGGATLPANPVGFVTINITGGNFKIPYYNI
jgi:hypothetical protein